MHLSQSLPWNAARDPPVLPDQGSRESPSRLHCRSLHGVRKDQKITSDPQVCLHNIPVRRHRNSTGCDKPSRCSRKTSMPAVKRGAEGKQQYDVYLPPPTHRRQSARPVILKNQFFSGSYLRFGAVLYARISVTIRRAAVAISHGVW